MRSISIPAWKIPDVLLFLCCTADFTSYRRMNWWQSCSYFKFRQRFLPPPASKDFCISQALTRNLDEKDQNVHPKGKQCVQRGHEEPPRCQWQQVPLAGEDDWCGRCRPCTQLRVILFLLALLIPALSLRVISKATCIKIFQIISALLNISLSPLVPWFYK